MAKKYIVQIEDLGDSCRVIMEGSTEQIIQGLFSAMQDVLDQYSTGDALLLAGSLHEQLIQGINEKDEKEGQE